MWRRHRQGHEPLGADYLKVGQVMEILRQKNVRLIASTTAWTVFAMDDDFTPFRNIMNEWYAVISARRSLHLSGRERQAGT